MDSKKVIFDPFFDEIHMPPADFLAFSKQVNIIFEDFRTIEDFYICDKFKGNCVIHYDCDYVKERMHTRRFGIKFTLGDRQIYLNEIKMLKDGQHDGKAICIMPIVQDKKWILGSLTFKQYYTVFDMESERFGFALRNEDFSTDKESPHEDIVPTSGHFWLWFFAIIFMLLGILLLCNRFQKKKKAK